MADDYGAAVYSANGLMREVLFSPFVVDQIWEMTLAVGVNYQAAPMPSFKTLSQPHSYALGSNGSHCQIGLLEEKGQWFVSRTTQATSSTETFQLVWLFM